MLDNEIDYEQVKARVEKRMALRAKFYKELGGYVTANIVCWMIWLLTETNHAGFPWPMFVTVFAGFGVLKTGFRAFFGERVDSALEEQYDHELQREIRREKRRMVNNIYTAEPDDIDVLDAPKRKNGTVRLSDDGELIYDEPEQKSADRQV